MCRWILLGIIVLGTVAVVVGKPPRGYDTRYYAEEVRPVAVDKIWVSTTGDMNAAASYSPSGVPVNTDSLAFIGPDGGGSNVSATINVAALDDVTLTQVRSFPSYSGDIGTVGTAAAIGHQSNTTIIHQGSGTWYIGADVYSLAIDSPNAVLAADLAVTKAANKSGIFVRRGYFRVRAGVNIDTLHVSQYRDAPTVVEALGPTDLLNYATITGGTVFCDRDLLAAGNLTIAGGTWVQTADSTEALGTVSVAGGTLVYNGSGSIPALYISSGLVDFTQDRRNKAVTIMYVSPGGDYIDNANLTIDFLADMRPQLPLLPEQ